MRSKEELELLIAWWKKNGVRVCAERRAATRLRNQGKPSGGDFTMNQVTDHFKFSEFQCRCGCGTVIIDPDLLVKLETARIHANVPFVLSSATRCEKHNLAAGGVGDSAHRTGKAVDIRTRNFTERYKIIGGLYHAGFRRIKPKRGFIHADVDEGKVQDWFGL